MKKRREKETGERVEKGETKRKMSRREVKK